VERFETWDIELKITSSVLDSFKFDFCSKLACIWICRIGRKAELNVISPIWMTHPMCR